MKRPLSSMLFFLVLGTTLGCGDNSNVVGSGGNTGAAGDDDGSSGSSNPSGGKGGSAGKGGSGGSGGGSAGSESEAGAGPIGGEAGSPAVVDCLQGATFEPADVQNANTEVVWERLTTIIDGAAVPVPIGLSAEVTAEEAGTLAAQIFDGAVQADGAPAGLRRFLNGWLSITEEVTLDRDWAALVCEDGNSLETLLALPDETEPARVGVFSDQAWLENKKGISGRGARLIKALGTGDLGALTVPPDTGQPDPQQNDETGRQWLARIVAPANCITCHEILDPWGHALEHFDQLGQYRDTDNGQPVNASDSVTLDGQSLSFADMTELAPALARSCDVAAYVSRLFLIDALTASGLLQAGEEPAAADVERVRVGFLAGGKTFRSLTLAVAQTEAVLR